MAFSSGTYSLASGNPVTTATTIQSSWANNTLSDIATALSTCLLKDGTQTVTANITFSGYRLTNLGAATATTDAVQAAQVQNRSITALTSVSGSNTIVGTATPTPAAYALGQIFEWVQATTNTGAATLNVSSLGAKNLYKNTPAGLAAVGVGDLIAGNNYLARYDSAGSTQFVLLNPSCPNTVSASVTAAGTGQSDATALTANINYVATVTADTGVKLSGTVGVGGSMTVYNGGANSLLVYPETSAAINQLAINVGIILPVNTGVRFDRVSTTKWIGIRSA